MTDNTENLILEHLKRFQAGQERIEVKLSETDNRLSSLELGQAAITQHIAHLSSSFAQQNVPHDQLVRRIERIERRLDLAEAP